MPAVRIIWTHCSCWLNLLDGWCNSKKYLVYCHRRQIDFNNIWGETGCLVSPHQAFVSSYLDLQTMCDWRVCLFAACTSQKTGAFSCTTNAAINTYCKSRATKYKMQLKFCTESYLPAGINSNTVESVSAAQVSDCSTTGLREGRATTSIGITCHCVMMVCVSVL